MQVFDHSNLCCDLINFVSVSTTAVLLSATNSFSVLSHCSCVRACVRAFLPTCVRACLNSCLPAWVHARVRACACVSAYVPACTHGCPGARVPACLRLPPPVCSRLPAPVCSRLPAPACARLRRPAPACAWQPAGLAASQPAFLPATRQPMPACPCLLLPARLPAVTVDPSYIDIFLDFGYSGPIRSTSRP